MVFRAGGYVKVFLEKTLKSQFIGWPIIVGLNSRGIWAYVTPNNFNHEFHSVISKSFKGIRPEWIEMTIPAGSVFATFSLMLSSKMIWDKYCLIVSDLFYCFTVYC